MDLGPSIENPEVFVPGMQYTLKNQASSITSRTEQTLFAQSHSFAPPNGRLIKFQMASAAEWCQLDTVKFVCELENLNQLDDPAQTASNHNLTLLGPPQVMFSELRILVNGVVVEQIQDFGRTAVTLNSLTPTETKIMNGMQALQMVDPWGQRNPVAPGELAEPAQFITKKSIESERYESLAPSEKRTISFTLAPSGFFQSSYMFPLMHGSVRGNAPRELAKGLRDQLSHRGSGAGRRAEADQRAVAAESTKAGILK